MTNAEMDAMIAELMKEEDSNLGVEFMSDLMSFRRGDISFDRTSRDYNAYLIGQ